LSTNAVEELRKNSRNQSFDYRRNDLRNEGTFQQGNRHLRRQGQSGFLGFDAKKNFYDRTQEEHSVDTYIYDGEVERPIHN